ncbi:MAG: hypothetical protein PF574_08415 [Candidatus Delongbacteria bacterium]|jgi:hypothetical protein|nr:hypothetical protein [Candidatus Delongbacteria bacterium]
MKYAKFLAIALFIALIVNCTNKEEVKTYDQYEENGIRFTSNNGSPADTALKIDLTEVGFIDLENEEDSLKLLSRPISFKFDKEDNLYVLDYQKCMIHKYNPDYEHINVFGGKGQGPGEFVEARNMIVKGDTIIISDGRLWKISKLDLNGDFIVDKKYSDFVKSPIQIKEFGSGFISRFYGTTSDETGQRFYEKYICQFDSNLNFVKNFYNYKEPYVEGKEMDPSASGSRHAADTTNLYVSVNSKTEYKIDVYDFDGNKNRIVRKNYARIKNSEEALQKQQERNKKYGMNHRTEFLNSIYRINTDKYGRLWVRSSVKDIEEGRYYDIFEDDIFQKRVKIDLDEGYYIAEVDDKIICVNRENNNIKIYDY